MNVRTIFFTVALFLFTATLFAKYVTWIKSEEPPVSLNVALNLANEELQKEEVHYFCIGASLARNYSAGDWAFEYSSKAGKQMWVSVSSDRKITKSNELFEYK